MRLHTGALVIGSLLVAARSPAVDVFDERGFHPNRAFFSQLPFEHIDPLTGNLLLTFTDLALPGNAGFDLRIQRTYNSKFYAGNGAWDPSEDSWAGVGWSLHMGRIWNPGIGQDSTIEMPDGSQHRLYSHAAPAPAGCGACSITKDYWIFDKNTNILKLPDGISYSFGVQTVLFGRSVRLATQISDTFGNAVSVTYSASAPLDRIVSISQDLGGGQVRSVTFGNAGAYGNLTTMTYDASGPASYTWTYVHAATTLAGYSLLTEVVPPTGPAWKYQYNTTTNPKWELVAVTTPQGGQIDYSYQQFSTYLGSVVPVQYRGVTSRTVGGRVVPAGTWSYAYPQGAGNASTITSPVGSATTPIVTTTTFHGVGSNSSFAGSVWKVGLPNVRTTTSDGKTKTETYAWVQSTAISGDQQIVGANVDADVFVPLLDTLATSVDGASFTTDNNYSAASFNDYGNPFQVIETGTAGVRTTTRTFDHAFGANYIRGKVTAETISVAGEGFSRTWSYADSGFLQSTTQNGVTLDYTPTPRGNVASVTNGNSHTTSFSYDWGRLKNTVTPLYTISRSINEEGTLASETRRGFTTSFSYDGLFREITRTPPVGDATTTSYNVTGGFEVSSTSTRGGSAVTRSVDGLGRLVGTADSVGVKTSVAYDSYGRKQSESLPFTGAGGPTTTLEYGSFERLAKRTNPDGSTVQYSYAGIDVTIVDERGYKSKQAWLAFGDPEDARLASVTEPSPTATGILGATTQYQYNALGSLKAVIHPTGLQRTWTYFSSAESRPGLLKSETHPESGTVSYSYDAAGNVKTRSDAEFGATTYSYDANERLTVIDRPGTEQDVVLGYDASDNRTVANTGLTSGAFVYDAANRLTRRTDTVSGQSFVTDFEYTTSDRLRRIKYASTNDVYYSYDAENRITGVANAAASPSITFADSFTYHPSGAPTGLRPGGSGSAHPLQTFGYHATRYWLTSFNTGARNFTYAYDNAGNTQTVTDARPGMNRAFTYDGLGRLKTASGAFFGSGSFNFSYDDLGNRTNDPFAPSSGWSYQSNRLTNAGAASFSYDANGNLKTGPGSFSYLPNNLVKTAGGAAYVYDADDRRVARTEPGGKTTYYVRGPNGEVLSEYEAGCGQLYWARDYVYAGSRLLAQVRPSTLPIAGVGFTTASGSVGEGAGPASVSVQVTTASGTGTLGCAVTVSYASQNGSAAGSDYTSVSGTLTFAAGTPSGATQAIAVPIVNDALDEDDEGFTLSLSNPGNAALGLASRSVAILDDDPTPSLSIGGVTLYEGDSQTQAFSFPVSLSAVSGRQVAVSFATADGPAPSASAASDYQAASGMLTFPAGTTQRTVTVLVNGDTNWEETERFTVNLSGAVNATLAQAQGLGTITDDDRVFVNLLYDTVAPEGPGAAAGIRFDLNKPRYDLSITVNYSTQNGSAASGLDYVAKSGAVTLTPGQASTSLAVPILTDSLAEGTESFSVVVTGAANALVGDATATAYIQDPPATANTPMYRAYNPNAYYHFFTTSQGQFCNVVGLGWANESQPVPFDVRSSGADGATAIYRMYNPNTGKHYYTTNAGERDYLMSVGWLYEMVEGFIFPGAASGSAETYRLYNNNSGTHLYTINAGEKDAILAAFPGVWVQHTSLGWAFWSSASGTCQ